MIIKKFQGKTEEEAVSKARAELGDALVIMNVRSVKSKGMFSIFRSQQKEVTVALEDDSQGPASEAERLKEKVTAAQEQQLRQAVAAVSEIAREHFADDKPAAQLGGNAGNGDGAGRRKDDAPAVRPEGGKPAGGTAKAHGAKEDAGDDADKVETLYTTYNEKAGLEQKLDDLQKFLKRSLAAQEVLQGGEMGGEDRTEENRNIPFFKILYTVMLENEVDEHIANQLIDELDRSIKPNMPLDYMLSNVYQKMILKFGNASTISPATRGPKFVFFVGPTGVGKTTTIAKIASKLRVEEKKKVALLTADTYRIAAAEQLRTYANILEVPFRVIYSPDELRPAVQDFRDYDYVLMDTAGHSHHNEEQRENMGGFIGALDASMEKEVYLVVSATTKYSDLVSIADAYRTMTDYKLIFTKLDETTTLGSLLNLKMHTGAQMSYITCGQNVPDDIEVFNPQEAVKQLLYSQP